MVQECVLLVPEFAREVVVVLNVFVFISDCLLIPVFVHYAILCSIVLLNETIFLQHVDFVLLSIRQCVCSIKS